jgi:hypothetical protein
MSVVLVRGQSQPVRVHISGDVTVSTSESLGLTAVSVTGRAWRDDVASTEKEFVFCITHAEPIPVKLDYTGKGRVAYLTPPNEGSAVRTKARRPERMLPALAVLQSDGESRFFLAEGQRYPHAPNEWSVGRVSTFRVVDVSRQDYLHHDGTRRGTNPSSCFGSDR